MQKGHIRLSRFRIRLRRKNRMVCPPIPAYLQCMNWPTISAQLSAQGYARLGALLTKEDCERTRTLYDQPDHFRSLINMARYRFGEGQYQYFAYPLPAIVEQLRTTLYPPLAPIARQWMEQLRLPAEFPDDHPTFIAACSASGQLRPTPLLLRYRQGDYNCLHQDLYGDTVFPFQVIVCLSQPGQEFTGGELLLVEQRPRAQSVGHSLTLQQGEAVVITTRYRPVEGNRGYYRAVMRHGVSPILTGERFTLGIVFHDAQ